MHILVTGATGQLGRAVVAAAQKRGLRTTAWGRGERNLADPELAGSISQLAPDLIVNTAAWTDVDGAEAHPDEAYATNALGPLYLAHGCLQCGAALVQVSTNEVFSGRGDCSYREYDRPEPGGVYARSKFAGEVAVTRVLSRLFIVRVAWLYGPGGTHFPAKIVAAADKHQALRVVDDEFGNPTYTLDVAAAILDLALTKRYGIYHLVNEGKASRYEFAQAVLRGTGRSHIPVAPIGLAEWPRKVSPPAHAVLVNQAAAALGVRLRPWTEALAEYLEVDAERFGRSDSNE